MLKHRQRPEAEAKENDDEPTDEAGQGLAISPSELAKLARHVLR